MITLFPLKQKFEGGDQRKDCFLCCAAMAAGYTYEDAWSLLNDDLRACFAPTARGPQGDQCDQVLARLGFERVLVGSGVCAIIP